MRRWQAMPVGEVLPVCGQRAAELTQQRLVERGDAFEYLTFGIGIFQWQSIVAQQAAEQGAVQQTQRFAGLAVPELLGPAGNIVGQAFGIHLQTKELLGCRAGGVCLAGLPANEGPEPVLVTKDHQPYKPDDHAPQQYFNQAGQGARCAQKPIEPGHQPALIARVPGCRRAFLFFRKAPASFGPGIAEGWLLQNALDLAARRFAGQGLAGQARRIGCRHGRSGLRRGGFRQRAAVALLIGPDRCGCCGKYQPDAHQYGIGRTDQALTQASEDQFYVPGFKNRAAIQIQREAAGDIYRFPKYQRQGIEEVGQVVDPQPLVFDVEQIHPVPVDLDLLRYQGVEQDQQAYPQCVFQVCANDGEQLCGTQVFLAEQADAQGALGTGQMLQLLHRQLETATQGKTSPQQAGQQLRLQGRRPGLEGLSQCRRGTEQ